MVEEKLIVGEQMDMFQHLPQKFKKSNYLINSKYKMTATEHKIFNLSLIKVQYNEKEKRPIAEISANEVLDMLGRKKSPSIYKEMRTIANHLSGSRKILLEDENKKRFKIMTLINVVEYIDGEGKLLVKFEPDAKDLILDLSTEASELYKLPYSKMKSYHSLRMYETFQSIMFQHQGEEITLIYEVDKLKYETCMIDLTKDATDDLVDGKLSLSDAIKISANESTEFKQYSSFKRTIDKAVKDINDFTNLDVTCQSIRAGKGGKVDQLRFIIKEKSNDIEEINKDDKDEDVKVMTDDELFDLIDQLRDVISEKLKISDYKILLEEANYDIELIKSKYTIAKESKSKITNLMGWLRSAIKNNYSESVVKEPERQKNMPTTKGLHFAGERQRTPEEWDELEQMLLKR